MIRFRMTRQPIPVALHTTRGFFEVVLQLSKLDSFKIISGLPAVIRFWVAHQ
jgi:hypothetical protein